MMNAKIRNFICREGRIWHPFGVRDVLWHCPGESLRSTPGYRLATLRVGGITHPSGGRGVLFRCPGVSRRSISCYRLATRWVWRSGQP